MSGAQIVLSVTQTPSAKWPALVAETIGSSNGVGYRLRQAADLVQTDQVFAWTLTLVFLMVLLEYGILKPLENHLFRWKKRVS